MSESSRSRQGLVGYLVRLCWVIHAFSLASDDGRDEEFWKVSSIRVQSHSLGSHSYGLLTTQISHLLIPLLKLMCPYMNVGRRKTFLKLLIQREMNILHSPKGDKHHVFHICLGNSVK